MPTERTCERCGIPLVKRSAKRFCSVACAHLAQRKEKVMVTCEWCGKEVPFHASKAKRRFCGQDCYSLGRCTSPKSQAAVLEALSRAPAIESQIARLPKPDRISARIAEFTAQLVADGMARDEAEKRARAAYLGREEVAA
jgi:hypothetical protein